MIAISFCTFFFFFTPVSFSAEVTESPQETIQKYKTFIKTASHPAEIAEAHYKIGYALEQLGKDTEATAEYLKIIVNYPDLYDINKKAEERLSLFLT